MVSGIIPIDPASIRPIEPIDAGISRAGGLSAVGGFSPMDNQGAQQLVTDFGQLLSNALDSLKGLHAQADELVKDLVTGKSVDLHDVMIAVEKASIALDLGLQLRNKAVEAYQEIMRMQV